MRSIFSPLWTHHSASVCFVVHSKHVELLRLHLATGNSIIQGRSRSTWEFYYPHPLQCRVSHNQGLMGEYKSPSSLPQGETNSGVIPSSKFHWTSHCIWDFPEITAFFGSPPSILTLCTPFLVPPGSISLMRISSAESSTWDLPLVEPNPRRMETSSISQTCSFCWD